MKIKTSELAGRALDWAVAKAEYGSEYEDIDLLAYVLEPEYGMEPFEPSTDWAQGGPIIEREAIELTMPRLITRDKWCATRIEGSSVCEVYGPTPLIAAMHCYVASKLGDEVDVPDELKE